MSEKLIVDAEWFGTFLAIHRENFDCLDDGCKNKTCLDCCIEDGAIPVKPAPASALFAEEMEDALIDMLATANERSITYGEGFSSCSDCKNADKLLVRIAAAKEGESLEKS